jgi:hypothetical protein
MTSPGVKPQSVLAKCSVKTNQSWQNPREDVVGGFGSGRWPTGKRKRTVEECFSLDADFWMREGLLQRDTDLPGVWHWFQDDDPARERGAVGFHVRTESDTGFVSLVYQLGRGDALEWLAYDVELQTTRQHFGGLRWWFTCPMCGRRVGKLYLGGRFFGWRSCYGLTYRSCQEAHSLERMARACDQQELQLLGLLLHSGRLDRSPGSGARREGT